MNIGSNFLQRVASHLIPRSTLVQTLAPTLVLASLFYHGESIAQTQNTTVLLEQAKAHEQASDYANAAAVYREYLLLPEPQSAARRYARLKLPVLQEAAKYGAGPEMQIYLSAMDARAAGNSQQADTLLLELIESYAGSALTDDAWYLRAYIALMDNYDYQTATEWLEHLRFNFPESRYIDTALFAEAISHEQMGDGETAIARMTELRERHTGLSFAGIEMAKDEYLSRLWFERSSNRIEYLQERAEIATRILSTSPYGRDGYQWQIELLVNQQHMTLLLNDSDTITNSDTDNSNNSGTLNLSTLSGIVAGEPDSWARITIENQNARGMISANGEIHELIPVTPGGSLSDFHTLLLGDIDGNQSESLDKTLFPPKSQDKVYEYLRAIKQVDIVTEGVVNKVAMIGVVIDSQYNAYHSGGGVAEALSILHATDGLFREQLGIALKIAGSPVVLDSENDPMNLGSVSMETMMRNFRDFRLERPELGSDIGLATLFSGNKNTDTALGLAWIGSACRTDGYDVSVVTPYKFPALLSTHEIGHTMGADHDTDTDCASQNQHIMWPFLSSTSGRTFSSCSKSSVNDLMAANFCHVDAMDMAITMDSVSESALSISISNLDPQRAIPDAKVVVSGPGMGSASTSGNCSDASTGTIHCYTGTLSPLNTVDIDFDFPNSIDAAAEITAYVEGVGFIDVNELDNGFKTDTNGNLSAYSGPTKSSITLSDTSTSSSYSKSSASAESGGTLHPINTLILGILIAFRKKLTLKATR